MLLGLGLAVLVVLAVAAGLAAFRYLPAYEAARSLRGDLEQMVAKVRDAGLGIDRATVDSLDADLAATRKRFDGLADLLANDPLVALARALPATAANVQGADAVVAAARDLLDAGTDGLAIGRRFVEIKEAQAASPATASAFSQLVELMATSRDRAVAAAAAAARARQTLATVPDGLAGQLEEARDAMIARLDEYGPVLDAYVTASARLPSILGWDAPRRYLVLTQNPAELRPTGGYIGSYGIIAFDKGRMTERTFQDVFLLDLPWDYPFIKGPQELHDYLLGQKQPWQLADSNWSPDFPTSAQDAIRLYANESGDTRIDGVLGITTFTIDELLKVTGPVTVPGYAVTIASGETTLKLLQAIWTAAAGGSANRKAILGPFADRLFTALLALPPARWGDVVGEAATFQRERLLEAWFRDPADQAFVAGAGFDGAVRQDPGDYVYPVDSNVAPTSKLNAVTTRGAGPERAARRVRQRPGPPHRRLAEPDRRRPGRPVPGAAHRRRGPHPGDVLPAPGPRAEPGGGGLRGWPGAPQRSGGRGGRGRPDGDRHVPAGPAGPHQPHLRVDQPVRGERRRDGRHLPAHDPEAARPPARAAGAHDPGARGVPDHQRRSTADGHRRHGDPRRDLRPGHHGGPAVRPGGRAVTGRRAVSRGQRRDRPPRRPVESTRLYTRRPIRLPAPRPARRIAPHPIPGHPYRENLALMDLRRQGQVVRSWLWLLVAGLLLAGGTAYLVSTALPKVYEAKATLLVGQSSSAASPNYNDLLASQRISQTYADLATTTPILGAGHRGRRAWASRPTSSASAS